MIPDHVVEEVRDRADIVEIIGQHVQLKRSGKDFKGLCPFHQEKTPSFYVVPSKGFFKCFGCGESGDVFSFLMKHLGLGFQEAVEKLAAGYGVEIPRQDSPRDDALAPLREAVAFAADYYQRQLWEEASGERARAYLESRGVGRDAAERFLLGYAPDEWRALKETAATHDIDEDVLEQAGLIKRSEKVDEPYDRFRDRLIFPITTPGGSVVAFGGRVLSGASPNAPKYLNSPETPLYHKGTILYGLHWARSAIRKEGAALVVEGYMDYVSLAAADVGNVVAPLGTAMTEEQAALLARYTRQALLLYDSDSAGLRATFRTGDALLRAGVHPLAVTLPAGEDPDSIVRTGGAAALKPYLDDAVDVLDRKIQILDERAYFEDVDGTRKAIDGLLPTLRSASDPALRDIYIDRVAKRTGVRRETLEREARPAERVSAPSPRRPAESGRPAQPLESVERVLLLLMVQDAERIDQAAEVVKPEEFRRPAHRELFQALVEHGTADPAVLEELEPEARTLLDELHASGGDLGETDRVFAETVDGFRIRVLQDRIGEIERRLAESALDERATLFKEINELRRELDGLSTRWRAWGRRLRNR